MPHCKTRLRWKTKEVALLTWTSAMDCWSWSIPARETCPMAVYGENAICQGCYAAIGRYAMDNVAEAQWTRFMWLRENLKGMRGCLHIIDTLSRAIQSHVTNGYFRVHDSGDFFNIRYAYMWYKICERCPDIKFWFPTRNWHNLNGDSKFLGVLRAMAKLPNVVIRPSALYIDEATPVVDGLAAGSGVASQESKDRLMAVICPKSLMGGSCQSNNCRSCWDAPQNEVYYYVHGIAGRHVAQNVDAGKFPIRRQAMKDKFIALSIGGTNAG